MIFDGKRNSLPVEYSVNHERNHKDAIRHFVSFSGESGLKLKCNRIIIIISAGTHSKRSKLTTCDTLNQQKFTILPLISYTFQLKTESNDTNATFIVLPIKPSADIQGYQLSIAIKGSYFHNILKNKYQQTNKLATHETDKIINNQMKNDIINEIFHIGAMDSSSIHIFIIKPNGPKKYAIFSIIIDAIPNDATVPYTLEKIRSLRRQTSDILVSAEVTQDGTKSSNSKSIASKLNDNNANNNIKTSSLLQNIVNVASVMQVTEIDSKNDWNVHAKTNIETDSNWQFEDLMNFESDWSAYFAALFLSATFTAVVYQCLRSYQTYSGNYRYQPIRGRSMHMNTQTQLNQIGFSQDENENDSTTSETLTNSFSIELDKLKIDINNKESGIQLIRIILSNMKLSPSVQDICIKRFINNWYLTINDLNNMKNIDWDKLKLPIEIEDEIKAKISIFNQQFNSQFKKPTQPINS